MRLHRMSMLAAGGVGYVLGAKAGRERYEQIRHAMHEAPQASERARDKVVAAAEKVRHTADSDPLESVEAYGPPDPPLPEMSPSTGPAAGMGRLPLDDDRDRPDTRMGQV
jgi:hypothetical protein